jgi:signal transduction histidine kinase
MKTDYTEGIKREVAEIKFLIHDLRVVRFINEIIHFHVTVNTDLEIYSIEQAQILHGEDLQALKKQAVNLRRAFQDYSSAVKNFSPDATILQTGNHYIETIQGTCELILNPLWGRIDKVLAFLPPESRSVRSRDAYRNSIQWMGGVSRRIRHFLDEQKHKDVFEEFDIAEEIENFTGDVIAGYVREKGGDSVRFQLDQLDSAVIGGNRYRFRRMYFNLVMNAVDAMANRKIGVLKIGDMVEDDRVILRVRDNGVGMSPEKIQQLLSDRETLDGELHSLGFVFVRQTVAEFGGDLSIESEEGEGTTVTICFPILTEDRETPIGSGGNKLPARPRKAAGGRTETAPLPTGKKESWSAAGAGSSGSLAPPGDAAEPRRPTPGEGRNSNCGWVIEEDYRESSAQPPGSIFAIAVTEEDAIEFFTRRPYDRYSNVTHEDLSPMCYEATVRGRLERDDLGRPVLTLKEPQSVREYFEFKNVPEEERSPARHVQMVHDEYIRTARKLIDTGMSPQTLAELTGLRKFFPGHVELPNSEPFPLERLARQPLSTEKGE